MSSNSKIMNHRPPRPERRLPAVFGTSILVIAETCSRLSQNRRRLAEATEPRFGVASAGPIPCVAVLESWRHKRAADLRAWIRANWPPQRLPAFGSPWPATLGDG